MNSTAFILMGIVGLIIGLISIIRSNRGMSDEELMELESRQYEEECEQYDYEQELEDCGRTHKINE
jgi:cell division protein FtsL